MLVLGIHTGGREEGPPTKGVREAYTQGGVYQEGIGRHIYLSGGYPRVGIGRLIPLRWVSQGGLGGLYLSGRYPWVGIPGYMPPGTPR